MSKHILKLDKNFFKDTNRLIFINDYGEKLFLEIKRKLKKNKRVIKIRFVNLKNMHLSAESMIEIDYSKRRYLVIPIPSPTLLETELEVSGNFEFYCDIGKDKYDDAILTIKRCGLGGCQN